MLAELRVPLANPDFAPFLQRARDAKPDALFVFVPAGVGSIFMKQFVERGLDKSGIRLIGTGDMTDDDILNGIGDVALGITTSHHYSAAHPSAAEQEPSSRPSRTPTTGCARTSWASAATTAWR